MVNQYPPLVGESNDDAIAVKKCLLRIAIAKKKKAMVGIVCTLIFLSSNEPKFFKSHTGMTPSEYQKQMRSLC